MPYVRIIRWTTTVIAIVATAFALWHSLIAPLLLFIAILFFIASLVLLIFQRKVDRICTGIATLSVVALVGIYFVPLWIAEQNISTPEDHVRLAERYANRGQLLGNPIKTQAHYSKAAEGGSVEARARLGEALYYGHYGTINREEGISWLKSAAASGHIKAQHLVEELEKK